MTIEEVKQLRIGQVTYHDRLRNSDGTPQRWRVNGKPKIWKTRPNEVRVPIKRGMYEWGYINEVNCSAFHLTEDTALNVRDERLAETLNH